MNSRLNNLEIGRRSTLLERALERTAAVAVKKSLVWPCSKAASAGEKRFFDCISRWFSPVLESASERGTHGLKAIIMQLECTSPISSGNGR